MTTASAEVAAVYMTLMMFNCIDTAADWIMIIIKSLSFTKWSVSKTILKSVVS